MIQLPVVFIPGFIFPPEWYEKTSMPKVASKHAKEFIIFKRKFGDLLEHRIDHIIRWCDENVPGQFLAVTHSRGGIDFRGALGKSKILRQRCQHVVMMACPHHGAPLADWVLNPKKEECKYKLIKWLLDEEKEELVRELTPNAMAIFNEKHRGTDNMTSMVFEASMKHVKGKSTKESLQRMLNHGYASDGTVPVPSQKWGNLIHMAGEHKAEILAYPYGRFGCSTIYKQVWARAFNALKEFDS